VTIVRLGWSMDEFSPAVDIATLLADGWDQLVVERDDAGWIEITPSTARLPIVENFFLYAWHDPAGDATKDYRIRIRKSADGTYYTSDNTSVTRAARGYCTIQDIRDEGFADPPVTDAMITIGIARATEYIDRYCRQWFEPRWRTIILDGVRLDQMLPDVPIIALAQVFLEDDEQGLADLRIYNRHLTNGTTSPDDRANPRVAFAQDTEYFDRSLRTDFGRRFPYGRKNVKLVGLFGHTELGEGDAIGHTAADSQIPLSLGQTPALIKRAAVLLSCTLMYTLASGRAASALIASRVVEDETKDQRYKAQGKTATQIDGQGLFGDEFGLSEVDAILAGFAAPLSAGGV